MKLTGRIVLFAAMTVGCGMAEAKNYTVQDEASRLLNTVEAQSYDLRNEAEDLRAGTSATPLDRNYFATEMETIRQTVNNAGRELGRLEALNEFETPLARKAIERAQPDLAAIAATTTKLIDYLDQKPDRVELPEFRNLTATLSDQTTHLWKNLHESVKLGNLRAHEQQLRQDLSD